MKGDMKAAHYTEGMWAELKVDCYGGDECDQHEPYWWVMAEGDRDSDTTREPLRLDPSAFPPGTKVVVEFPACPRCDCAAGVCSCGFDWKRWAEDRYA